MKERVRFFFWLILCLLLRPGVAEAVKVELDEGSSTSSASMSVTAYSNVEGEFSSDSDSWSDSGIQYNNILVQAYQAAQNAICGSSAAASVSMSMTAHGASPKPGEQSIEGREIYDIRFYAECLAEPCPTQYPYTPILAGFSCQLNAEGSIVWELLPSNAEEMAGMPVIVFFDPVHYSVGGTSGGTVYDFRIYDWEYGVIGQEMEGPYEVASYADPPDYEVTPVPDWEDLIIHASIGDKIRLSYKMVGYGYTQDDKLVPSHLERDGDYPTMGLSLGVWVTEEKISIEDPVWSGESDHMVLPYDKVDLDFVVHNHGHTDLFDVDVKFEENTDSFYGDAITLEKSTKKIDFIAAGGSTIITNAITVAGLENEDILEKVVEQGAWLFLHDAITAKVGKKSFTLSPRNKRAVDGGLVLAIQYPDFITHSPQVTTPPDDSGYYGQGDYDYHHLKDQLVRAYAVKASLDGNRVFPDDVSTVVQNIYLYADGLFKNKAPGRTLNDKQITDLIDSGNLIPYAEQKEAICITHAYLVTSFARTIGVPAREVDTAIATGVDYFFGLGWRFTYEFQEAGAQVWYDAEWHLWDSFLRVTALSGYLHQWNLLPAYRCWYAFDRRASKLYKTGGAGHDFGIDKVHLTGAPIADKEWRHLRDDDEGPAILFLIKSPVCSHLVDGQGNITGCIQGEIAMEIPSSRYIPKGTRVYADASDPGSESELNETICVTGEYANGDFSLRLVGTDSGPYDLITAYVYPEGTVDGSTVAFNIRKNETQTYEVHINPSGEITFTGIAARIDINPDTINLSSVAKYVTCYIELPEGFDVSLIDGGTVELNGVPAYVGKQGWAKEGPNEGNIMDHDEDGVLERMVKFDASAIKEMLQPGENSLTIRGEMTDETVFEGTETINVIDPKK